MMRWSQGGARSVVGAALCAVVLGGCGTNDSSSDASGTGTSSPASSGSSGSATSGSSTTTSTSADAVRGGALPVYWIGDTKRSTFLYREFVPKRGGDDDVTAALSAMTSQRPANPAWKTVWHSPKRLTVRRSASGITVDLSSDAFAATGVSARQAAKSVQQLVWTATAAAKSQAPVTVLVDGRKGYRAWNAVTLGAPTKRIATARAPIWVDSPAQGDTVKHGRVTVTGTASVFEGNVVLLVKNAAGKTVAHTNAQGGAGTYRPYRTTVSLPTPGRYTLTAYEPDESDGEGGEGAYPFAVTTTFTVR